VLLVVLLTLYLQLAPHRARLVFLAAILLHLRKLAKHAHQAHTIHLLANPLAKRVLLANTTPLMAA